MNLSSPRHYSVVSRATAYGLDGPGIESRGVGFSAPVQTGPEAHPASCTMGTGSFLGVRCSRGVTLTPQHPPSAEVKKFSRAIPLLSLRAFVAYERVKPTYLPDIKKSGRNLKLLPSLGYPLELVKESYQLYRLRVLKHEVYVSVWVLNF